MRAEEYTYNPEVYREAYSSRIDKVVLTSSEAEKHLIRLQVRDTRAPEVGDKFASRHGQKGIVGALIHYFIKKSIPVVFFIFIYLLTIIFILGVCLSHFLSLSLHVL